MNERFFRFKEQEKRFYFLNFVSSMRTAALVLFLLSATRLFASQSGGMNLLLKNIPDTLIHRSSSSEDSSGTNSVYHLSENKRVVAAILAFPPFGCLGLHRIYLGTDPWIPVVYVLTLGGCGLIAIVDFIEICTSDQPTFDSYSHNGKVFMWGK